MRSLSDHVRSRLRCPVCKSLLTAQFQCTNAPCGVQFPVVDGIPILIDERTSIFALSDFTNKRPTFFNPNNSRFRDKVARLLYENTTDLKTAEFLSKFSELLTAFSPAPTVLVIGAGTNSAPLQLLQMRGAADLVVTDVSLSGDLSMVCDAHDLPFEDATFDGVVAQAVLEHVVDPYRCVKEIHRVLRSGGVVFSDTPFMQQVHGGRYDFTRFTHLGQRRLFREFEEVESGASAGPGLALSWSYQYFLTSFATSRWMTRLLRVFAKLTSFWWKYFDRHLLDKPGALDAASTIYFIGRKSDRVLDDRSLIDSYRGANQRF